MSPIRSIFRPISSDASDFDYRESAEWFGWKCIFFRIMRKMEYISKCSILVLKTVYIMMQMVRCGYAVGGVKNVATFFV